MFSTNLTLWWKFKKNILPVIPFIAIVLLYMGLLNWLPHVIYKWMGLDVTNKNASGYINLVLPIDHQIPFVVGFVIPYLLAIIWWAIAPLFIFNWLGRKAFFEYCVLNMIANTIAFILFLSVPTINTLRPDHINANVFWTWSINLVYHSSIGLHLFPSGHSLCMWMIVIVCIRRNTAKYFSAFSVAYAIIVSLSALFIKQHELVDVLCGFSIAISVGILVRYLPIFKFTNNLFIKINHFLHIWEW